jgi:ParB family chromosome partitioning protein
MVEGFFSSLGRFSVSSFYTHRLPLLRLPDDLLEAVRRGQLEYTKVLAISKIKDEAVRVNTVQKAVAENLSLVQLKAAVKELGTEQGGTQPDIAIRASVVARALRRRDAVKDARTQKRIEKLLKQLEDLLATNG